MGVRRYCGSAVESSEASILDPLGTLRSEAVVQTIARLCPRRHDGAAGAAPASPLPGNDVPLLLVRGLRRGFETRAPNAPRINGRLLLREIRPPLRAHINIFNSLALIFISTHKKTYKPKSRPYRASPRRSPQPSNPKTTLIPTISDISGDGAGS